MSKESALDKASYDLAYDKLSFAGKEIDKYMPTAPGNEIDVQQIACDYFKEGVKWVIEEAKKRTFTTPHDGEAVFIASLESLLKE